MACLKGVAASRAYALVTRIARRYPALLAQPWPRTPKARAIALRWVRDMCTSEKERGLLADEFEKRAEILWKEWEKRTR